MRALFIVLIAVLLLGARPLRADDFNPPGLATDAERYQADLHRHAPAGGTPAARRAAEDQAAAALARNDWTQVAEALETRIGLGQETPQQWLDLADALLHRAPPDARHAVAAAWNGYTGLPEGPKQLPALLLVAQALRALDRNADAVLALEHAQEAAPNDGGIKRLLTDARRAAGLMVRNVRTEADADPPRACIAFSVAPVRRADFNAQDWVRLDPPQPGAAVTREDNDICISGIASGAHVRIILRAGLPGEDGISLVKETVLGLTMPDRPPAIAFDTRLFVLPRGQAPAVALSTVNVSAVALTLYRLTERNIPALLREVKLGQPVPRWTAENVGNEAGNIVWQGKAEIPHWTGNKAVRTALPFPDALSTAGPGLYALLAVPGDGTPDYDAAAVQLILRTDLAPTVWRGADGLTVQVRSYADATVQAGVKLQLLARNNDILGDAVTDADGVARFPAPLLRGDGPLAPADLHAFAADGDFAAMDLNVAAFDLSDRGVQGAPDPGPLDAFVWLDRGIYRPGETVQVMALLRDNAGAPADIPAQVTVKRPNGQIFLQATPKRLAEASLHLPVTLSTGAAAGTWTVEVRADPDRPPIGKAEFRVDAFVPDRMAVDLGKLPEAVQPGATADIPVTATFLYGAPGAGLTGKGSYTLNTDPSPFVGYTAYHFGLVDESYAPQTQEADLPETDAQGHTTFALHIAEAPDTTRPLKADIAVEVDDPSGHGSKAAASLPVRGTAPLLGIRPAFKDDAVNAGGEAAFDIVALAPDGKPVALPAKLRLLRERPDWHIVMRDRLARYEVVYRDEPLETRDIAIAADAPFHFAKALDWGRYRIEVTQPGGLSASSYRFRSGWTDSDSPDVPDRVDVSADKRAVPVGETARIHIAPPFAGEATVLVLTDKVHAVRTLSVPEAGADVDIPVEAAWGPGAYVAVHLYRPGKPGEGKAAATRPSRAIGLTWIGVDPAARTLPLALEAAEKYPPRARALIPVTTAPGAWVTLAAVDEGILRLTRFASPDPAKHFLGRRQLGLDIRDDWGRLLAPAEGEATLLKQGGDESSFVLPDIPQRTVTLFTPPVQADANGHVSIPLDLPDFAGQIRLMLVGWQGNRIGSAAGTILVRDPLVAEALLPRFLAPGDDARITVLLHDLDLPKGEAAVTLTTEGPLSVTGPTRVAATLDPGQQALPGTILHGTGAGRGVLHMDITGPAGFHIQRDTAITVRPSRGRVTYVAGAEVAPGAEALVTPSSGPDRFIPGTWRMTASFGAPVRYDTAALVRSLTDYPYSCLEQSTSRGLPLALLPDGPTAGENRAARLQAAVQSVLDRQRYDGAFGLWSASGEAEPWLSAYAMDFLLRARKAGALVPEAAIKDGLKALGEDIDSGEDKPDVLAARAYHLYVLAEAGQGLPGAARVLAEHLDKLPTPLARAQIAAALALAHDRPRAEAAFNTALDAPARDWWWSDYGTALRDQAATLVLLKESGLLPARLAKLVAALPGANLSPDALSTQETAWLAGAAAALGRDGRAVHVALGGVEQPATAAGKVLSVSLTAPAAVRNLADKPVWASVSITGVPAEALPAARNQMRVSRRFFALDGSPLDLDHLRQNTVFVVVLEGRAEDSQEHHALAVQGLPAGWEIAARLNAGAATGLPWLGELTETEAQPAADDRFAAVVDLTGEKPSFRVAVRVRAVTPGEFELPGAELSDMYRPAVFARQNGGRIKVQGVE
jgi:uncharacterized protein YfaS (alpha-2-macroglobulin family)